MIQELALGQLLQKGGKAYHLELSNFQPRSVGRNITVHSHIWVGNEVDLADDMKIQAFCFIPNGVKFERGVFLGPRVTITNDINPPHNELKETLIKEGAALGAGVVVVCGVTIGRYALVGAGSVVTRDIPDGEIWVGNPARFLKKRTFHENHAYGSSLQPA